jgi:hypothetical protein
MNRRWTLFAAAPAAAAVLVFGGLAAFGAKPVATNNVLCGSGTAGTDDFSGSSDIDHPSGASFTGSVQPAGHTCKPSESSAGTDFAWAIDHSNVNISSERGTEHGDLMLAKSTNEAGFDGHITDFDYKTTMSAADPATCGSRTVYYTSGHSAGDNPCAPSSGPGNFNTHGGAGGSHFRGDYGTVVYQQNDTSMTCNVGSMMYCIQVDLNGQTN